MINIKSLKDGGSVEGLLAVRNRDGPGEGIRDYTNKSGRFFVIKVGNSLGEMPLKYWGGRNPEKVTKLFAAIEVGDILYVKGRCVHDSYNKGLVISLNEDSTYGASEEILKKADEKEYEPGDFISALPGERIESLFSELKHYIEGVENDHLKGLLERFFNNIEFAEVFKKAPAAKRNHHNYIGGLLEHSVNVANLCDTLSGFYSLDRDLLITGALLHDMGKTREYSLKASIGVTDEGKFIGHIPITAEILKKEIDAMDGFPETLGQKVIHMILSHHGKLEYGSPKVPMFPEAEALFNADYMDASVKNTLQEIEDAGEGEPWIYSRSKGRFIHTERGQK